MHSKLFIVIVFVIKNLDIDYKQLLEACAEWYWSTNCFKISPRGWKSLASLVQEASYKIFYSINIGTP